MKSISRRGCIRQDVRLGRTLMLRGFGTMLLHDMVKFDVGGTSLQL